jgi:hypothetical protein
VNPSDVTACLVTRGNVNMDPILDSLIFPNVIVWNNLEREDARTYGRYLAAEEASTDVVYFQDDDTLVSPEKQQALLDLWEPGVYLSNMEDTRNRSEYPELIWPGWGSMCARNSYQDAFRTWLEHDGDLDDYWFQIVGADIVHSMLTADEPRRVDLGVCHLDYALDKDRAYVLPGFLNAKKAFYEACQELKVAC